MENLLGYSKPRGSVFDETKRDDVLNLTDLVENNIDPGSFFMKTFPHKESRH